MIKQIDLAQTLFFDIETVSNTSHFEHLSEPMQAAWIHKAKSLEKNPELTDEDAALLYRTKAGIYSEFGKIICISVGIMRIQDGIPKVRLKSFASDDEKELLGQFSELLNKHYANTDRQYLCGHNIREFDVPYCCRRLIINKMPLPRMFDVAGKKPWEVKYLADTMELWKFGDIKAHTSLKTLCAVFDIPSPKGDIDGSQVGNVYWDEGDLLRISQYCERDVLATIRVLQCMRGEPAIPDDLIEVANAE